MLSEKSIPENGSTSHLLQNITGIQRKPGVFSVSLCNRELMLINYIMSPRSFYDKARTSTTPITDIDLGGWVISSIGCVICIWIL